MNKIITSSNLINLEEEVIEEFDDLFDIGLDLNVSPSLLDSIKQMKSNVLKLGHDLNNEYFEEHILNYYNNILICFTNTWEILNLSDEDEPNTESELENLIVVLSEQLNKSYVVFFNLKP